jgi:hypothetical protein
MENYEFVETETGKKALKLVEEQKKELYDNWGYTQEELDHIELCMLKVVDEMYFASEEWEENTRYYAKQVDKYRKILLEIANAVNAKSPVVDGTAVMEEAMFLTLPQEIRKLKDNEFYKN